MILKIPQHVMLKLRVWRDFGNTEVTGFFVTEKDNESNVIDAHLVKAKCSATTVHMKPDDIGDFYHRQIAQKIYPDQLQIWWHTHPGNSASPSGTDETTFEDLGKDRTFNIMYILARGGQEFAQLSVTDKRTKYMIKEKMTIAHPNVAWSEIDSYEKLKEEYDEMVVKPVYVHSYNNNVYTYTPPVYNGTAFENAGQISKTFLNDYSKPTQRELFEQKKRKDHEDIDPIYDDIIEQIDAEYQCCKNYNEFMILVQEMVEDDEVSGEILNKWFKNNQLNARCKDGNVIYNGKKLPARTG
jgi:proteasome lid subunit RPN8/RPN11